MVIPTAGNIVVISFPFSDLSQSKHRPALVLAAAGRDDWILCQITSKPYGDPHALELPETHFEQGGLRLVSYVRPGKLFTANQSLLLYEVGVLRAEPFRRMVDAVISLLRSGLPELDE